MVQPDGWSTHPDYEKPKQTLTVPQHSRTSTITMTNAVPREYIYPDIRNRQQSIVTRSTPVYHAPVITAGITHPQIHQVPQMMGGRDPAITQASHPVYTAQQQTQTLVNQPWARTRTPGAPTYQLPTGTGHNQLNTGFPYGASDPYMPLPRENSSV